MCFPSSQIIFGSSAQLYPRSLVVFVNKVQNPTCFEQLGVYVEGVVEDGMVNVDLEVDAISEVVDNDKGAEAPREYSEVVDAIGSRSIIIHRHGAWMVSLGQ
ncbi:hypothetical protein VNO78_04591 [Psophocarpus tetragonolobus]|uniref:Uncharacterized protein n=1 Tax=Psophocarpus tetragonolobus TaxID=3891 RepID=A0AAN9T2L6_PSOTE